MIDLLYIIRYPIRRLLLALKMFARSQQQLKHLSEVAEQTTIETTCKIESCKESITLSRLELLRMREAEVGIEELNSVHR